MKVTRVPWQEFLERPCDVPASNVYPLQLLAFGSFLIASNLGKGDALTNVGSCVTLVLVVLIARYVLTTRSLFRVAPDFARFYWVQSALFGVYIFLRAIWY